MIPWRDFSCHRQIRHQDIAHHVVRRIVHLVNPWHSGHLHRTCPETSSSTPRPEPLFCRQPGSANPGDRNKPANADSKTQTVFFITHTFPLQCKRPGSRLPAPDVHTPVHHLPGIRNTATESNMTVFRRAKGRFYNRVFRHTSTCADRNSLITVIAADAGAN